MKKILLFGFIPVLLSIILLIPSNAFANDVYQNARDEYLRSVSTFQAARQDYLTAKDKLITLRTASQRKDVLEKAKDFLLKADQTAIKYLATIRKKIEAASGISEPERQASLAEIDGDTSWLIAKQGEIQSASTKEELTSLGKQIKDHWQKIRIDVKRITGKILSAKINAVLIKLEEALTRVAKAVNNAKAAGRNTSQLESWLSDARKKLDLAKEKYDAGKNKFQAISNLEEANTLFNEGTAFVKEANQYLLQAHKNLKDIVKQLRKQGS